MPAEPQAGDEQNRGEEGEDERPAAGGVADGSGIGSRHSVVERDRGVRPVTF